MTDKRLCELAEFEFIKSIRKISYGDNVEWSLFSVLQLNQLVLPKYPEHFEINVKKASTKNILRVL